MSQALDKPIVKKIHLTPRERKVLESKCQNRLNWSDGGHWIGGGRAPNCFIRENIHNVLSHTYNFTSDAAALKWNLEWEKLIRHAGHFVTAAISVATTYLTKSPLAGITVGTIAAITKDEVQASIPYPRMARGWSYEFILEYHLKWSAHPMGVREFKQKTTTISRDMDGKIISTGTSVHKFELNELPDGLGRALASKPSKKTSSDYK